MSQEYYNSKMMVKGPSDLNWFGKILKHSHSGTFWINDDFWDYLIPWYNPIGVIIAILLATVVFILAPFNKYTIQDFLKSSFEQCPDKSLFYNKTNIKKAKEFIENFNK